MNSDFVISIGQQTLLTALQISAPILGFGLVVGLIVSIFQAATQIQEQSLSFIPKIIAVIAVIVIFGPWMLTTMSDFTTHILSNLSTFVR